MTFDGYLLAYFLDEQDELGEQIRLAVSTGRTPTDWQVLGGGSPLLVSTVGERGARDPFLVRDEARGVFVLLATDLRIWPDGDWHRAMRHGSRSLVVWQSPDLIAWSAPRLVEVSPPEAGNTWAPKAFWSDEDQSWLVFWAAALFAAQADREAGSYQRILAARTDDFRTFTPASTHLDFGHDVIDLTFLRDGDDWYRFSANAHVPGGDPDIGQHIFAERGPALEHPEFAPLVVDIGKDVLKRGEGPAPFASIDGDGWYLLIDEFGHRGYQLFHTRDLAAGRWHLAPGAKLPAGARHGSVIPITAAERSRLLEHFAGERTVDSGQA